MNVTQQNTDSVNTVITIEIVKADYEGSVEKALKNYRQKANVPGFRKGMVPMGMVRKMFGKSVQMEEINNLVSEKLTEYIKENKLNVLGQPIPSEQQAEMDLDADENFSFVFDVALAPVVAPNLSQEDVVDFYQITVSDEMVAKQIEQMATNYSTQTTVEVAAEKDMLKGTLTELDEAGNAKEDGIVVEDAVVSPAYFKNDEQKAAFAGVTVAQTVVFNPAVASDNHEAELASMLHVDKEVAATVKSNFSFEVKEITSFQPAAIDQELFDKVYGEGTVTTEEEFRAKVAETLAQQFAPESDYKFGLDARKAIEAKVGELELPVATLKRWMAMTGEDASPEKVEEEFPAMVPDLTWHLVKEQIVKDLAVKVENEDVLEMARKITKAQFAQYGMMTIPDEIVDNYAKEMLKDKERINSLVERANEEKIVAAIKAVVTLNVKEVTPEEFYKMFEEQK